MKKSVRYPRSAVAVLLGLGALLFFVVGPVFGTPSPDADHLHLSSSGDYFSYGDTTPIVQPVAEGDKGCEIDPAAGPLVNMSSAALGGGGVKGPGIFDHGIGVKSGGSNGTPCSETSDNEQLIIASNGNAWFKLRLNVEAKGNAWIEVDLVASGTTIQTHTLVTGDSIADYNNQNGTSLAPVMSFPYTAETVGDGGAAACADPNDSGPDSGPNDNCLWTILTGETTGEVFDEVRIHTLVGSVSLEGGGDFEALDAAGVANGLYDSLFYRAGAPTANDDDYTTAEDTPLNVSAPGVLSNDTEPIGASLTASLVTGPSNGSLTLNSDGSFDYTPNLNYNGPDSFTYQASSGGDPSETATVDIVVTPVNDIPEVKGPLTVIEDTPTDFSGSDLATDVDGDTLTITAATASAGTATVNPLTGVMTYTPPTDSCVNDVLITFTVVDGQGGVLNGQNLPIIITCVNDAPVADDDAYETDERNPFGPVTLTVPAIGVLDGDTDADMDALTAINASGANGTVTLATDGSFTYLPGTHDWTSPAEHFSYTDTWTYNASDGVLTGSGTVTITVHRVICSGETVTDVDGEVSGSFKLLTDLDECKRYSVDADEASQTVTFNPDPRGGEEAFFRGEMTFAPQILSNGTFSLGLQYDPDNDGENWRDLLVCLNPVFDTAGKIISADIPNPGVETWCLAGALSQASAEVDGEIVTLFQVYGTEDPGFNFK